eukprot:TRINITY_DN8074_c0_g1_i2.p1 TRINITY_DN8074_c0_g1~~TRINITY_DN8074_c0_g1_i2.p1  ORF type:complete len:146 (+),score=21.60 TRINITY_DN8074_c0_g1_i2:128-565(+)
MGVRGVINTCDEYTGPLPSYGNYGMKQIYLPIPDYLPPSMEIVEKSIQFIKEFERKNQSVLVHCKAGRGRSTTIVLCYLIQKYNMTPKEAQDLVCSKRPQVSIMYQRKVVYDYYEKVKAQDTENGVLTGSDEDSDDDTLLKRKHD